MAPLSKGHPGTRLEGFTPLRFPGFRRQAPACIASGLRLRIAGLHTLAVLACLENTSVSLYSAAIHAGLEAARSVKQAADKALAPRNEYPLTAAKGRHDHPNARFRSTPSWPSNLCMLIFLIRNRRSGLFSNFVPRAPPFARVRRRIEPRRRRSARSRQSRNPGCNRWTDSGRSPKTNLT